MNATSANMLLKLIEEPPSNTIFLLVSEDPGQLLITLSSRAQPVKLPPVDNESIIRAIEKKYSLGQLQIENIVRIANGSIIQALEAIQSSEENDFNLEKFIDIMRLSYKRSFFEINNWVEEMSLLGREKLKTFFDYALHMVRENLILNLQNPNLVYLSGKESDFSARFHPFINGKNVIGIYNEMNQASADIERNAYAKIVLFDFAFRLVKLIEPAKVKK